MAPQTRADAQTVAKMLQIKHTVWADEHGTEIRLVEPKRSNGRPNKHPKVNADITLQPFKMNGMDEESTRVFIGDAWPVDYEAVEANEQERRVEQGQGPRIKVLVPMKEGGFTLASILSPTKKHWSRPNRRIKNRIARRARTRNARQGRKVIA